MVGPIRAVAASLRALAWGPQMEGRHCRSVWGSYDRRVLEQCKVCGRDARLGWELLLSPVTCGKGLWVRHGRRWVHFPLCNPPKASQGMREHHSPRKVRTFVHC